MRKKPSLALKGDDVEASPESRVTRSAFVFVLEEKIYIYKTKYVKVPTMGADTSCPVVVKQPGSCLSSSPLNLGFSTPPPKHFFVTPSGLKGGPAPVRRGRGREG